MPHFARLLSLSVSGTGVKSHSIVVVASGPTPGGMRKADDGDKTSAAAEGRNRRRRVSAVVHDDDSSSGELLTFDSSVDLCLSIFVFLYISLASPVSFYRG